MRLLLRAMLATALVVASGAQLSCNVNDYCLNCAKGDAGSGGGDGGDGGGGGDASDANDAGQCIPSGPEICDGIDNDCNGLIDDGVLPGVGDLCANQKGACAGGVQQCVTGALKCSKLPSPEVCDGIDNDCNGLTDEGDPGGGGKCGTDVGECVAGTNHCVAGHVTCQGFVDHTGDPELCNGKDDDCDGMIDENINLGPCTAPGGDGTCASPPCGDCTVGTLVCNGGQPACDADLIMPGIQPPRGPTFEICDNHDNDCDGVIDNGFDLNNDPQNCGGCNHACSLDHAIAGCSTGTCTIASCDAGWHDNDGIVSNGCEFGPCFISGPEVCDGVDNDCDGNVDEDVGTPPSICATKGECAGTIATCDHANGWVCHYGSTVSTQTVPPDDSVIVPETLCDNRDNDCNGIIDDHQSNKGQACNDGNQGICRVAGLFECDPSDLNGPAICDAGLTPCNGAAIGDPCSATNTGGQSEPGTCQMVGTALECLITKGTESCNNQDDDCDGVVDNTPTPGSFPGGGLEWVNIGGGHQIMKYEAAKPDASASGDGSVATSDCGAPSTLAATGASEVGTTATFTTTAAHGLIVGRAVVIAGVTVAGYNGAWTVTSIVSATKFTATLTSSGLAASGNGTVSPVCPTCSQQGVIPWTNVTYPQAVAACAAVGATLCSEQQWHRACSVIQPTAYPVAVADRTFTTTIEAEDYFSIASNTDTGVTPAVTHSWVSDYTPGFSGISAMLSNPNSGSNIAAANSLTRSPRLDYQFTFAAAAAGTWRVCVRGFSPPALSGNNNNTLWVGINPTLPGVVGNLQSIQTGGNNAWRWMGPSGTIAVAAGTNYVSLYMETDGLRVDQVYLTTANACPATTTINPTGGQWAYATNPSTYQPTTCNGHDYDPLTDATLATGTLASCYADDSTLTGNTTNDRPFDMSGNVKEWTLAHQPGENPIRGGSSNNTGNGIDCPLNFTLADDTFFFTNVGFRCCR